MNAPRSHPWRVVAGMALGGATLAAGRTILGKPFRSPATLSAAGVGLAAGGLMTYQWLSARSWLYGPVFWHAPTNERVIALTFDDGPCHPHTEQLLKFFENEDIKATFFMVGHNVRREPTLAAEVVSAGHAVGNHTFTHPHLTWSWSSTVRDELQRGQEAIEDATGTLPTIFRVPHGWYGPQVISTAADLGLRCVGWSVMAWDWNKPPVETIERRIMRGARPGGVTLLHDGEDVQSYPTADRSHTVAAVPHIVSRLKNGGFRFVTVPQLMELAAERA